MKSKHEHAGVGWLISEELLCTKMKGSAIHKRLTLLHLPCLCLCLLFSSTSAVNESRLRLKTGEWTQWQGKRKGRKGKGQSVCVGRAQRRKVRLRNNEEKGEKEINSVGREEIQKGKERKGSPVEGTQGRRSENHEFLFRTSQRKKLRRNRQKKLLNGSLSFPVYSKIHFWHLKMWT